MATRGKPLGSISSVFISYGDPDLAFAQKLQRALEDEGVNNFLFPLHAQFGKPLHEVMKQAVEEHDRVVLICSRHSLDRPGVQNEIEETLRREAREGGAAILLPITLDDFVFADWNPDNDNYAKTIRDRVIGDFSHAASDDAEFQSQFDRLLRALEK